MSLVAGLSGGAGGRCASVICVVGGIGLQELLDYALQGQNMH